MQAAAQSQNGQQQNHVSLQSKQEPDSDDGNNALQSGDENDQDDDHDSSGAVRNGKRKRPISVSYVFQSSFLLLSYQSLYITYIFILHLHITYIHLTCDIYYLFCVINVDQGRICIIILM